MGSEIPVCPGCDSTRIRSTRSRRFQTPADWKCETADCGIWFDTPHWRERQNRSPHGGDTIASVLAEMDSDDVPPAETRS